MNQSIMTIRSSSIKCKACDEPRCYPPESCPKCLDEHKPCDIIKGTAKKGRSAMSTSQLDRYPYDSRLSRCRDCGGTILWLKTKNDKNIQIEVDGLDEYPDEDEIYDRDKHECHFAVCPDRK